MNSFELQEGQPALAARALTKAFLRGRVLALRRVSLEVPSGEALGIVGPNGAGKSTLLALIAGLLRPSSGEVLVWGRSPDDLAVKRILGYVPERFLGDPSRSCWSALELYARFGGIPRSEVEERIEQVTQRLQLARELLARKAGELSKGNQQRLMIAQALLGRPKLLLLDEPTSGLDPEANHRVRDLLRELHASGVTLLLNSHRLEDVERICTRVVFLEAGTVTSERSLRRSEGESVRYRLRWAARGAAEARGGPFDPVTAELEGAGARIVRWTAGEALLELPEARLAGTVARILVSRGFELLALEEESRDLESWFLEQRSERDKEQLGTVAG